MVDNTKSAKKRRAKGSTATPPPRAETPVDVKVNGHVDVDGENPHIKETQKQIRNLNKKLAAVAKTEAIVNEHKGTSLDELVSQKKINADQKAQILKKSSLEDQLAQLENQHKVILDVIQDSETRFVKEKQDLVQSHQAEAEKVKEEATRDSNERTKSKVREALHITCQFLHAAAFQRQREDVEEIERSAYETVLFRLYQGNNTALDTLSNVVEGSNEKIVENGGNVLDYTYAQLKNSAMSTLGEGEDEAESQEAGDAPAADEPTSDPTVANAALTELEDTTAVPTSAADDVSAVEASTAVPEQASTASEAANAVAESAWNPEASMTTNDTQVEDWVQVPRDPAETETGTTAPAAQQSTSNWADEAGAAADEQSGTPVSENDGFSEVRRERGGRGRGGRGGRGFDGRGRGRGRGEFRGRGGGRGRGGPRGGPPAQAQAS